MSSRDNWNETRPSSAVVPDKTLQSIRELKKDKIASGGNMKYKIAEDQKTSDDRWKILLLNVLHKKRMTMTIVTIVLTKTRKILTKRKVPPPDACDTNNKQFGKRRKKAAVTTATTKTRTTSKAKAKANINNDDDDDDDDDNKYSLLMVEITS